MKIAFLSDIHANFTALCKALESASRHGASQVVVAGDCIGGGPHPVEVIRLLAERKIQVILGNVERKLLSLGDKSKKIKKNLKKKNKANLAWTWQQLGEAEKAWVAGLPEKLLLKFNGVETLVVHGSPKADTDYIFPSITAAGLLSLGGGARSSVLVCGHSHLPFTREIGGVRVVNCGSVGRPVDGDPRGSYALVDYTRPTAIHSTIVRFTWPVAKLVQDLQDRDVPGVVAKEYLAGIKRKGA